MDVSTRSLRSCSTASGSEVAAARSARLRLLERTESRPICSAPQFDVHPGLMRILPSREIARMTSIALSRASQQPRWTKPNLGSSAEARFLGLHPVRSTEHVIHS